MKRYLLLLIVLLVSPWCMAQLDNTLFEDRLPIKTDYTNNLFVGINTMGFVKNNEYFNKIADGYTLFGYQAHPKLIFFPSPHIRIEAGAFARKDFGNPAYSQLTPTFTLKYQKNHFAFVFGTLEGSLSHRLIEPLYDFERVIYDRIENGAQFIYNRRYFYTDTWINWERMIYRGSPFQEVLTAGISSVVRILDKEQWKIGFPLQFITSHEGGQITSTNLPVTTLVNGAIGMQVFRSLTSLGFFRNIKMESYYVVSKDLQPSSRPSQQGHGTYLNLSIGTAWLDIMGSYWRGNGYIASRGGALYSSLSSNYEHQGYFEQQRELFILRLLHQTHFSEQVSMSARLEPYYDFNSQDIEMSLGLYLQYRPMFLIKKDIIAND